MGAPLLVSAAALLDDRGRVLVQRRAAGRAMAGLWEFPGGKIEPGETPEAGLARELSEELGIAIDTGDAEPLTFASVDMGTRPLVLLLYGVRRWRGEPRALDADGLMWLQPSALRGLAMPPADLPFIEVLERWAPSRS